MSENNNENKQPNIEEDNYVYNSTSSQPSHLSTAFWIGVVALCVMTVFAGVMTAAQFILRNNAAEINNDNQVIEEETPCEDETDEDDCEEEQEPNGPRYDSTLKKPIIYIYNHQGNIEVSLDINNGDLFCEYPRHTSNSGTTYRWQLETTSDGTLYTADGNEYSYIFWEALSDISEYNFDDGVGYCVKGENTEDFLRDTLSNIGLTPKEYNEFIVYWLPQMQNNEYNLIKFYGLDSNDLYNNEFALTVKEDDNIVNNKLRVYMIWKSSDNEIALEPQDFTNVEFDRYNGTAVVEWGGTEIH